MYTRKIIKHIVHEVIYSSGSDVCTHLMISARVLLAPMIVSRSLSSKAVLTVFIK